ncbi:MAG: dockerin type I domain-containing protein [bacterium]
MRVYRQKLSCAVPVTYLMGSCLGIIITMTMTVIMTMMAPSAWSAEAIKVFLEGAYTENNLGISIYANTYSYKLVSAGVKLQYDPAQLSLKSAHKNEKVWFMKDVQGKYPYVDPNKISTPGEVIIIVGKLDLTDPNMTAVTGERVLLAKVEFERNEHPKDPPSSSLMKLGYARDGKYVNFVTNEGKVLDHKYVTFGSLNIGQPVEAGGNIIQRGDADGNGTVEDGDIAVVEEYLEANNGQPQESEDAHEWVDCNNDGIITIQDINCIQAQLRKK